MKVFGADFSDQSDRQVEEENEMERNRGFTLVELLVVIAVMIILAGLLMSVITRVRTKSIETRCEARLMLIDSAVRQYKGDFGDYPLAVSDWSNTNILGNGKSVDELRSELGISNTKFIPPTGVGEYLEDPIVCPNCGRKGAKHRFNYEGNQTFSCPDCGTEFKWTLSVVNYEDDVILDPFESDEYPECAPIVYLYKIGHDVAGPYTANEWPAGLDSTYIRPNNSTEFQLWSKGLDGKYNQFGGSTDEDKDNICNDTTEKIINNK